MTPAVVHLDLDGADHIFATHGWVRDAGPDGLFYSGLEEALRFFASAAVRATLFVIADDLRDSRKRALLAHAVEQGHEIASHSLTHRKLTRLSADEKRREVFESRDIIASALGVRVRGFRAPAFDVDRSILELLDDAGYAYDSSTFPNPAFARRLGVERLACTPQHPLDDRSLLELPLPDYAPLPAPFHPSYSLVLGNWYFELGLRRFARSGAPLVLLFHLTDFADPLPRAQRPGWQATLFTLSHLTRERKVARCRRMLDSVRQHYDVIPTERLQHAVTSAPPARDERRS